MSETTASRARWQALEDEHRRLLRARYRGNYRYEAAIELLLRHNRFANHDRTWIDHGPAYLEGIGRVDEAPSIDFKALVQDGVYGSYSSTERHVMAIAASLVGSHHIDLDARLSGHERRNMTLILAAISHATGQHQQPAGALVPWPEEDA